MGLESTSSLSWVTSPRSRFSSCLAHCAVHLQHSPKGDLPSLFSGKSHLNWISSSSRYNSIFPSRYYFIIRRRETWIRSTFLNYNNFKFICLIIIYIIGVIIIQTTGMHSHLMQYMTPKGGPKSANQVEPSSRICLPNVHSAARWGLLAQSSSIKGATLRVRTVRGQEMTISKIDNRLLWKCIFGTFKKSLVVSLILFLSSFLPISFSLIFSVTLAFAYVQFAVSSLALVHGCFNAYSAFFLCVVSLSLIRFSLSLSYFLFLPLFHSVYSLHYLSHSIPL